MALTKCKKCGGTVEYNPGEGFGVCRSCGARQEPEATAGVPLHPASDFEEAYRDFYETVFGEEDSDSADYWESVTKLNSGFLFLEDEDWAAADAVFEQVLANEPKNAEACLGKLMAALHCKHKHDLAQLEQPFDTHPCFERMALCGNELLTAEIRALNDEIGKRAAFLQQAKQTYTEANAAMQRAYDEKSYRDAAALFRKIPGYEDAAELEKKCLEEAECCRKDDIYRSALLALHSENRHNLEGALRSLDTIPGWGESDVLKQKLREKIEQIEKNFSEQTRRASERDRAAYRAREKKQRKKRRLMIAGTITGACLFTGLLVMSAILLLPAASYKRAIAQMEAGHYVAAYEQLSALSRYKDSLEKAQSIFEEYKREKLATATVGETVYFGNYPQSSAEKTDEDISWTVLDEKDGKLLLISQYGLDCRPFHKKNEAVTWESCSLRSWLNKDFYEKAFNEQEREKIVETKLEPGKNPEYDTDAGKATTDKVFILSVKEAERYFSTDEARMCEATAYAAAQGSYKSDEFTKNGTTTWWFLRSPGMEQSYVAYVHFNGTIGYFGGIVNNANSSIRPVIWVDRTQKE